MHQDIADESEEEQTEVQKLFSDVRDLQYVRHKHSLELKVWALLNATPAIALKI